MKKYSLLIIAALTLCLVSCDIESKIKGLLGSEAVDSVKQEVTTDAEDEDIYADDGDYDFEGDEEADCSCDEGCYDDYDAYADCEPYEHLQMKGEIGYNAFVCYHGDDDLNYYELYDDELNKQGPDRKLKFVSYDKKTHELVFKAYFEDGTYIGDFKGILEGEMFEHTYKGVFTNKNGGKVNFDLWEDGSCWD